MFIGKDLTVLSGQLIRGESLNTRQRTQGDKPLVFIWQDGLILVIATQDRDFAVMVDGPLNMSFLCSVTRKRKPNSGRCEERRREKACVYVYTIYEFCCVCSLSLLPKPKCSFPLAVPKAVQDLSRHFHFLN